MNRQQAKELLPIIQAYAEGKTIQVKASDNLWYEYNGNNNKLKFDSDPQNYRIKPEPKYRPFKNREECWQEMLKHQPFGWVKAYHGHFLITGIKDTKATFGINDNWLDLDYIFGDYKFIDGTPFGIKE